MLKVGYARPAWLKLSPASGLGCRVRRCGSVSYVPRGSVNVFRCVGRNCARKSWADRQAAGEHGFSVESAAKAAADGDLVEEAKTVYDAVFGGKGKGMLEMQLFH